MTRGFAIRQSRHFFGSGLPPWSPSSWNDEDWIYSSIYWGNSWLLFSRCILTKHLTGSTMKTLSGHTWRRLTMWFKIVTRIKRSGLWLSPRLFRPLESIWRVTMRLCVAIAPASSNCSLRALPRVPGGSWMKGLANICHGLRCRNISFCSKSRLKLMRNF